MSSRKEQKEQLRAERIAREQAAAAGAQRKRMVLYGLGGILAVAAVVGIVVLLFTAPGSNPATGPDGVPLPNAEPSGTQIPAPDAELVADLDAAAEAAGCEVETNKEEGDNHVETKVTYEANPPTSGDHFPVPADDGSYTEAPPVERQVHSLEHGRIYIQYAADAPATVRDQLQALYDEDPYHMILAPNNTDMPYEVAATMWNQVIGCPEMNDQVFDAIRAFREEWRDQGPEFIP